MDGGLMRKEISCDENTVVVRGEKSSSTVVSSSISSKSKENNKSKIRIIHIFAPEIIKANFRELVQRLTGKPTAADCRKRRPRRERMDIHAAAAEEEEEIWRDANTGGGFLGGFPELDHFPFLEGPTLKLHQDVKTHNLLLN